MPRLLGGATLTEIENRAHGLLHTHELLSGLAPGWRFGFETAASRTALCRHRDKTIAMAVSYALRAPWHEIVDTLLQEIAHAIVGPDHKHDRVWKAKAREIGCTAERCTSLQHSVGGWLGRCSTCSRAWTRHRLTAKMRTAASAPGAGPASPGNATATEPPPAHARPRPVNNSAPPDLPSRGARALGCRTHIVNHAVRSCRTPDSLCHSALASARNPLRRRCRGL